MGSSYRAIIFIIIRRAESKAEKGDWRKYWQPPNASKGLDIKLISP